MSEQDGSWQRLRIELRRLQAVDADERGFGVPDTEGRRLVREVSSPSYPSRPTYKISADQQGRHADANRSLTDGYFRVGTVIACKDMHLHTASADVAYARLIADAVDST